MLVCCFVRANFLAAHATPNSERIKVLIGFTTIPGPSEEALVKIFGGTIRQTYHVIPAIAAELPSTAIENLQRNSRVTIIEPVIKAKHFGMDTPIIYLTPC